MVEAAPAASFKVAQAQFLFQLLIIALDDPTLFAQGDQVAQPGGIGQIRHPVLQDGVDRSVIALWLGHESVETTQIYLEATLAMKQKALEKTEPLMSKFIRYHPGDQLLGFLNSL